MTHESLAAQLAPNLALLTALRSTGNVTKAAELLGVPQPTVSRRLAALGEALGSPLTRQIGRGIRLTRAGTLLAEAAERALATVETGARQAREEIEPATGQVVLGFLHLLGRSLVPALVSGFRATHPQVRFTLIQGSRQDMLDRLLSGELDLVLVAPAPADPTLESVVLTEQELFISVPDAHRLARRRQIRFAELAGDDFVTHEHGYGIRQITEDLCAAAGFQPKIAFEGQESDTVRGLVAAGLGVSLLTSFEPSPPAGVVELALTPKVTRQICLTWPADDRLTPAVRSFRDYVRSYDTANSTSVRAANPVPPGTTSA